MIVYSYNTLNYLCLLSSCLISVITFTVRNTEDVLYCIDDVYLNI